MHITNMLRVGALLLTIAASLDRGEQFLPFAMPVIIGLLALRYRVPDLTRSSIDARLSAFILDVLMGIVFVLSVGAWTLGPMLVMAGYAANHLVIVANGLSMPCIGISGSDPVYSPVTDRTRLRWLADIFRSREGTDRAADFSVGDAMIAVGLWVYAAQIVLDCLEV